MKAAVAVARKAGDLEQRLADSQKCTLEEEAACESELSRLGRFVGTIESLLKIAMPVSETLDRYERQFDAWTEKVRDCDRRQKEFEEDQKQAEQELKALLLTSDVPTISGLEGERLVRNTGWNLIKQKYIEEIDVEKDIAEFASDSDLPTFYERKVDISDTVSDRMRLAADQVVKRADLEAKIENLKLRHNNITEDIRKTNQKKEVSQKEWTSIWEPLGVDPGSPREMKQWLLRVDKLLSNVQMAKTISGNAKNLSENCKTLKESISLQILNFDDSIDLQEMSLEAMINLCEQRVEREESALERKRQLEHSQGDAEIRLKRAHEELKSIKADQANWIQEWGQAIDGLGLKSDIHPEQATETFDQLLTFFINVPKVVGQ